MKLNMSPASRMMSLSLCFTLLLIGYRVFTYGNEGFLFFVWNLLLAAIPLFISSQLVRFNKVNIAAGLVLLGWLLFLPNAPYLVTDIVHFAERPPVSKWFDLLLIASAAWNGLMLGFLSLMQVEQFLTKHFSKVGVHVFMLFSIFSSAYGVYLGRFLRFNSWDVVSAPDDLLRTIAVEFLRPQHHINTWMFTLLFGAMLYLFYYTTRYLPTLLKNDVLPSAKRNGI